VDARYLSEADDFPYHQQATPFALAATSDSHFNDGYYWATYSDDWYVALGLRLHANNNVMNGFAGIVHGSEQRSVRLSRALHPRYADTAVGPLQLRIGEPMRSHHLMLGDNPTGVTVDLEVVGQSEPFVEAEARHYQFGRLVSDVLRYTVVCRATGTVSFDGEVVEVDQWHAQRDHSWGIRSATGPRVPIKGVGREDSYFNTRAMRLWVPFEVETHCGFFHCHEDREGNVLDFEGRLSFKDGKTVELASYRHQLRYEAGSRRLAGGLLTLVATDGTEYEYEIARAAYPAHGQALGYAGGWGDGGHHGVWRGADHVEHDRFDVSDPVVISGPEHVPPERRIGGLEYACHFRSANDGSGMGNVEHVFYGPYLPYGIT
jgi:hypothetical protein